MTPGERTSQAVDVDAGGVRLHVEVAGRDADPAVVLLHGTSANGHVWDAVLEALSTPVRSVRVDQRGHGRSGQGEGYLVDDFVGDVLAIQRSLALGPVLVVGHSLGARNACVLAARHPEVVAGVVAVDYTPYVEQEVLDALATRVAAGDRRFASLDDVRAYLRDRYPRLPSDAIERRARFGYVEADGALRPLADPAAMQELVEGLRVDYPDDLAAVRAPMTLLRGADSAIVSVEAWRRAKPLAPDARWVDVPEADHYIPEERPAAVAAEIDAMLQDAASRPQQRTP